MKHDSTVRQLVRERANFACEYCRISESVILFLPFHIEHIVAKQHRLDDSESNLALSCDRCNAFKGPNLSSLDPETNELVRLFHPRIDDWGTHFSLIDGKVCGLTSIGRATVKLLNMNAPYRVQLRINANA